MKLYRNFGNQGTPSWTLVAEIGDAGLPDFTTMLADLKRRGNNYVKALPSMFDKLAIEFRLIHGLDKPVFEAILDDKTKQRAAEWAICDGAIATNGTYGLRLPVHVEQFPWDQPLEDVSGHDVRLVLAYMEDENGAEIDPQWIEVGGSAGSG